MQRIGHLQRIDEDDLRIDGALEVLKRTIDSIGLRKRHTKTVIIAFFTEILIVINSRIKIMKMM